ncbi:MAG TPA: thymidine phosphorylase [Gemmatimonadales bacterium]|nr:thymidine phosphorylase [Gemmatimonadales bacterium]
MHFTPLIERKRDGGVLTPAEWQAVVAAYLEDEIPDYQMSAMLMAICCRGLERQELVALTGAMLGSGASLDFGRWDTPRVDKHSTGGVGDKISLVLAPLVASLGVAVPMMSGRGLGHTGGTTDKLESIPGLTTALDLPQVKAQVERIGVAMFGQTPDVAPADRRLYALRDVTGTVPSIPLIAASIMSKKLAEGLTGLVLDVKAGSGAFMSDPTDAVELARTMVDLGEASGCRTTALVTAMDRPLGRAIGNALEIEEALQALEGKGPEDVMVITKALAIEMLVLAGQGTDRAALAARVSDALLSGKALAKFRELIEAQGGNPAIVDDPGGLPQAAVVELFESPVNGVVAAVAPRPLGQAVVAMGGGRQCLGDTVDHSVGFVVSARTGARVRKGEPIASVFARDDEGARVGLAALAEAITYGEPPPHLPLISHRITRTGVESF